MAEPALRRLKSVCEQISQTAQVLRADETGARKIRS